MNVILSPGRRLRPGQLEMLALLAIVLLALALRAYHLGTKSLWLDELNLLRSADGHGSLFRRFSNTPNYSLDHPPAYLLLLRVVMLTMGREEWMLRLPALVASVACIPALWMLGRMLFGPAAGLIAALLLTLSPMHVAYGQEAHNYGLFCLLSILLLWALVRAAQAEVSALTQAERPEGAGQPRRARWLLTWGPFILLATFSLYVHYYAFYPVALSALLFPLFVLDTGGGGLASLWREPVRRRMLLRLSAALATVAVLYVPMILLGVGNSVANASNLASAFQQKSLGEAMGWTWGRLRATSAGSLLTSLAFLVILITGLGWLVWRRRPLAIAWLLILIVPLPPSFWLAYQTGVEFNTRRIIFILPVLMLLAAVGTLALVQLAGWLGCRASTKQPDAVRAAALGHRVMTVVAALAVAAIIVFSARPLAAYYRTPKQDWKGAGRVLTALAQPTDAVVAPPRTARNLTWYYPQVKSIKGNLPQELEALCRLKPRVYFAIMANEPLPRDTAQWISQQFVQMPLKDLSLYYRNCNAGSDSWHGAGASGLFELAYNPKLPYPPTRRAGAQYQQLAAQHGDSRALETGATPGMPTPAMPAIEPTRPASRAGLDLSPASPPNDSPHANASALLKAGQADEALDIFQAIVQENPGDRAGRMGLAASLAAVGQTNEALDEYQRIERASPGFPWAFIRRGELLEALGQERAALREYRAATKSDHGDASAYFVLGFAFMRLEKPNEAIAQFQAGLALDSTREGPRKALEKLQQQP